MLQSKAGGLTQSMSFISMHFPHEITAAIIQPLVRWTICPFRANLRGDIEGRCEAESPIVSYNCRFEIEGIYSGVIRSGTIIRSSKGTHGWDIGKHNPPPLPIYIWKLLV